MKCTNANRGTFNHECGKPALWIGIHHSGHAQAFCLRCRAEGDEARTVATWTPYSAERLQSLREERSRKEAIVRAFLSDY